MHRQRRATPTAPLAAMPARRAPRRRQPADWSSIPERRRGSRPAAGSPGASDHADALPRLVSRHEGENGNEPSSIHPDMQQYVVGSPGVGKSHALSAVGHAQVEAGHSVLCAPAYALVQELLGAKRDLDLPRTLEMATRKGPLWPREMGPPFLGCGGHRDVAGRSGATGGHVAMSAIAVAPPVARGTPGCVWRS